MPVLDVGPGTDLSGGGHRPRGADGRRAARVRDVHLGLDRYSQGRGQHPSQRGAPGAADRDRRGASRAGADALALRVRRLDVRDLDAPADGRHGRGGPRRAAGRGLDLAAAISGHGVTGLFVSAGLFRVLAEERPECFRGVREIPGPAATWCPPRPSAGSWSSLPGHGRRQRVRAHGDHGVLRGEPAARPGGGTGGGRRRSAGPVGTLACTPSTSGCGRCPWGCPASCTSRNCPRGPGHPWLGGADGTALRGRPVRGRRRADVPHR
ncbi:hypothetical protein STENM327S_06214 [Streptomyces tendae]